MQDVVGAKTLDTMSQAKYYNDWILDLFKPYLKGRIAEVGAGIGTFSKKISRLGYKVTAFDYNSNYLEKVVKEDANIEVFRLDIQTPALPAALVGKYDTVVSFNVLEHVPDHTQAIKNIGKLITKGGKVILLVPAFQIFYNKLDKELGHVRRYSKENLTKFLESKGFVIKNIKFINPLGLIGWWLAGNIFGQKVISSKQVRFFDFISRPLLYIEKYISMPFGISIICIAEKI